MVEYTIYKVIPEGFIPADNIDESGNFEELKFPIIKDHIIHNTITMVNSSIYDPKTDTLNPRQSQRVVSGDKTLLGIIPYTPWSDRDTFVAIPNDANHPIFKYQNGELIMQEQAYKYNTTTYIHENSPFDDVINRLNYLRLNKPPRREIVEVIDNDPHRDIFARDYETVHDYSDNESIDEDTTNFFENLSDRRSVERPKYNFSKEQLQLFWNSVMTPEQRELFIISQRMNEGLQNLGSQTKKRR